MSKMSNMTKSPAYVCHLKEVGTIFIIITIITSYYLAPSFIQTYSIVHVWSGRELYKWRALVGHYMAEVAELALTSPFPLWVELGQVVAQPDFSIDSRQQSM